MTKNEMLYIKSSIVEITEAINSVIRVDVTVIDNEYNRIAATGEYISKIGNKVAENSVFFKALKTGNEYIVESPRVDVVCKDCYNRGNCKEFAEVSCPIINDGNIIGIIGLIAFDEFQRDEIIKNKLNLLKFLRKMAELISSKIIENRQREKLITQSKEIEVLLDYMDCAFISLDINGNILRGNESSNKLFDLNKNTHICDINDELCKLNLRKKLLYNGKIEVVKNKKITRYLYNTKPIIVGNSVEKIVVIFSKEKDLIDVMNDIVNIRQSITFEDIIGESRASKILKEAAKKSSKSTSTVLIQGESGTGKELYARAIHSNSERCNMPFVPVNCAAIPENLIESELFGYTEGSFTGALKGGKPGKFEIADGGTIFLDEIGDMPIHLQSKLLRVLQEREVERIGSKYSTSIDVRVIAATHQNLEELIKIKMFREDLYYRLNVIPLNLIPLRKKLDDIPLLADVFLERYSKKLNKKIKDFNPIVLSLFKEYSWKGNIREMENAVEYAVNMCNKEFIDIDDIPPKMILKEEKNGNVIKLTSISELEKNEIKKALSIYKTDKEGVEKMVEILGLSRATLYRKIKEYNL